MESCPVFEKDDPAGGSFPDTDRRDPNAWMTRGIRDRCGLSNQEKLPAW